MLIGHYSATMDRLQREPVVLVPADTTSLNFRHLPETEGLGAIGPTTFTNQQGLWLHSAQAFTPQGLPLGILAAQFWARPWKRVDRIRRNRKPFEEKEGLRWRES